MLVPSFHNTHTNYINTLQKGESARSFPLAHTLTLPILLQIGLILSLIWLLYPLNSHEVLKNTPIRMTDLENATKIQPLVAKW